MSRSRPEADLSAIALERDSAVPMYLQLAGALERSIGDGVLPPGRVLPSEAELCRRLAISRITVRQAIDALIEKRLVERRQGKGTFVAHHLIRHDLQSLNRVFDTLFAQDHAPASELLAFGAEQPPADVAAAFMVDAGTELVRLDRVYRLEGRPIGLGFGWMLPDAAVVSAAEAAEKSTARLIEETLGLRLGRRETTIRAAAAGRTVARLLDLAERSPVLVVNRRRHLTDGRVADVTRFHMNADTYEFSFEDTGAMAGRPALKLSAA